LVHETHLKTTTIGLSELVMSMQDLYMIRAPERSKPRLATCIANCGASTNQWTSGHIQTAARNEIAKCTTQNASEITQTQNHKETARCTTM